MSQTLECAFKTIKSFWRKIYNDDLSLEDGIEEQVNLKDETDEF